MTIGFVVNFTICMAVWLYAWFCGHGLVTGFLLGWVLLPFWMWTTIRFLEEASAHLRSVLANASLLRLMTQVGGKENHEALHKYRCSLSDDLTKLLPVGKPHALGAEIDQWCARSFFLPWRRWKADWHETISLCEDLGMPTDQDDRF